MVRSTVVLPLALEAWMVYLAAAAAAVGVPEMTPVWGSRVKPAGSALTAVYWVTAPPLLLGESGVMAVPTVYTAGLVA